MALVEERPRLLTSMKPCPYMACRENDKLKEVHNYSRRSLWCALLHSLMALSLSDKTLPVVVEKEYQCSGSVKNPNEPNCEENKHKSRLFCYRGHIASGMPV
jgi:hypothetical protein